jgi:hypothetical protein
MNRLILSLKKAGVTGRRARDWGMHTFESPEDHWAASPAAAGEFHNRRISGRGNNEYPLSSFALRSQITGEQYPPDLGLHFSVRAWFGVFWIARMTF